MGGWSGGMGNVRSFLGNSMGGLKGRANLASWIAAGTLAYFLWVKPSQQLKKEQQQRAAAYDPNRSFDKTQDSSSNK